MNAELPTRRDLIEAFDREAKLTERETEGETFDRRVRGWAEELLHLEGSATWYPIEASARCLFLRHTLRMSPFMAAAVLFEMEELRAGAGGPV